MPECSCTRCLEAMLREFHPAVRPEDIRITRVGGHREPRRRRRAA
ncbi:MAG TPA: hypothetical protein VFY37_10210 [Solirubrobacterales bacterium]|nr:hypothetical protein [Solirubrobacterales bacterium]